MTNLSRWLATALATVIAACGGAATQQTRETTPVQEPPPPPPQPISARGETSVHARVGSAGGTLELGNGARLEIPEGALTGEVEVHFGVSQEAREAWDDETKRALGPSLEVSPALVASSGQFRVSCPAVRIPDGWAASDLALGQEEEAGQHRSGSTRTRWQYWPARIEGNRFVSEVSQLGGHRIQFGVSR